MSDSKNIETLMEDMKTVLGSIERIEANQSKDNKWLHDHEGQIAELNGFMNRAKGVIAIVTLAVGGLWALALKLWPWKGV